jgi:hypothetical protein
MVQRFQDYDESLQGVGPGSRAKSASQFLQAFFQSSASALIP